MKYPPPVPFKEPLKKLVKLPVHFTSRKGFPPAKKIKIYDDTLRDGELMPGVAFAPEQKAEMAIALSRLGVHVMDVAFPSVSASERKSLQLCLQAKKIGKIREEVEIVAMCRALPKDIDHVIETVREIHLPADSVSILILSTASDLRLKYKLGKMFLKREGKSEKEWLGLPMEFYRAANNRMVTSAIAYARGRGIKNVEFGSEDASRSDLDYLLQWVSACTRAGGSRFCFADTVGCLTPESVDYYFPPVVKLAAENDVELHAHFHNDLGLAAYNCVRALSHGVSHAGVTICGIGEHAGNAPMEQVVMQLKLLYGINLPGFKYHLLTGTRKLIEKYSGISIQPHMPVVGEGVFSQESEIHLDGISTHPVIDQLIQEKIVSGTRKFVLGKHAGGDAIEETLKKRKNDLKRAGISVTRDLIQALTEQVKKLREKKILYQYTSEMVRRHYDDYYSLGVSEDELLDLALRTAQPDKFEREAVHA